MFKFVLLLALAIAGASAQSGGGSEQNSAPEPYAYAYQTDSSSASEQRTPDGKVTGYYTINDPADGRTRRVEYVADESGFRAKVETNEVGTKSENSADVEVSASPPSEAQYAAYTQSQVYQQPPQQQQAYQQFSRQQQVYQTRQPAYGVQQQTGTYGYYQQPYGVYNSNYGYYQPGTYSGYQSASTTYGNNAQQRAVYGGYGAAGSTGSSYNYHTPAQYYSGVQGVRYGTVGGVVQPSAYTVGGVVQPSTYTVGGVVQPSTYGVGGGQNVVSRYVSSVGRTVPTNTVSGYSYSSGPIVSSSSSRTVSTSTGSQGGAQGSGNLVVLKK